MYQKRVMVAMEGDGGRGTRLGMTAEVTTGTGLRAKPRLAMAMGVANATMSVMMT